MLYSWIICVCVCSSGPAGDCFWEWQPGKGLLAGGDQEEREAERRGGEPHPAQPWTGAAAQSHHQWDSLDKLHVIFQCLTGALEWRLQCAHFILRRPVLKMYSGRSSSVNFSSALSVPWPEGKLRVMYSHGWNAVTAKKITSTSKYSIRFIC